MDEINYEAIADYAITVLREGGWCKNRLGAPYQPPFTDAGTEHCAVGAVNLALTEGATSQWPIWKPATQAVYARLADILDSMFPHRQPGYSEPPVSAGSIIANINNHPDTTEDDIIAALEKLRSAAA